MAPTAGCHTWKDVIARLRSESPGAVVRVLVSEIEHPLHDGMVSATTEPVGQRMDFLKVLDERTGCHVRDFGDCYDVWLYALPKPSLPLLVDPPQRQVPARQSAISSLADLPRDAPGATVPALALTRSRAEWTPGLPPALSRLT